MAQFDVFANPIPAARSAFPFVVTMQSDFAATIADQIVAPVAAHGAFAGVGGRLTPKVDIRGKAHAVFIPRITTVRSNDLTDYVGSVILARGELLSAIDLLFFGI